MPSNEILHGSFLNLELLTRLLNIKLEFKWPANLHVRLLSCTIYVSILLQAANYGCLIIDNVSHLTRKQLTARRGNWRVLTLLAHYSIVQLPIDRLTRENNIIILIFIIYLLLKCIWSLNSRQIWQWHTFHYNNRNIDQYLQEKEENKILPSDCLLIILRLHCRSGSFSNNDINSFFWTYTGLVFIYNINIHLYGWTYQVHNLFYQKYCIIPQLQVSCSIRFADWIHANAWNLVGTKNTMKL